MNTNTGMGDIALSTEARVAALENRAATLTAFALTVVTDADTGAVSVYDSLTWLSGWESYTVLTGFVADQTDPDYPGGVPSTAYGVAQAYRIANTCFLTGLVRRRVSSLAADTRYTSAMFRLPTGWRPTANTPLLCAMGSTAPDGTLAVVSTAWVEVRPDITQTAGRVYFITGGAAMTVNTSWIALQGSFPVTVTGP